MLVKIGNMRQYNSHIFIPMAKTYILTVFEYDNRAFFGPFKLSDSKAKMLENEVEQYNNHWNRLRKGEAPSSSYQCPEERNQLFHVSNARVYDYHFKRPSERWLYEMRDFTVIISLLSEADEEYDDFVCEDNVMTASDFIDMLEKPYGHEELYIGFGCLPVTLKVLGGSVEPIRHKKEKLSLEESPVDDDPLDNHNLCDASLYENEGTDI